MLTKSQILQITLVGDLFTFDAIKIKSEYKSLVKQWHPDNGLSHDSEVFEHITQLYHKGLKLLEEGAWEQTNTKYITKANGKIMKITYQEILEFELGKYYVCPRHVICIISDGFKKYVDNALVKIRSLKYANENMRVEFSRYVPNIIDTYESKSGEYVIVMSKTEDVFPLKTVFGHYSNQIDCKHVAWIISRLQNITCFLQYNNISHLGINLSSCFISPQNHSILLFGGWWYTTNIGSKIIGTSKDIYDILPAKSKTCKNAERIIDLESIKALGRQLLGEPNGRKLAERTDIPKSIVQFFNAGSESDAIIEFNKWNKTLDNAYERRQFTSMNVTKQQLYQQ